MSPVVTPWARPPSPRPRVTASRTFLHAQAATRVQLRREPHLSMDDPVSGQVLDELTSHTLEVGRPLHHLERHVEPAQVVEQVVANLGRDERVAERRGQGQPDLMPDLAGRVDAHATIEVEVQLDLGQPQDGRVSTY